MTSPATLSCFVALVACGPGCRPSSSPAPSRASPTAIDHESPQLASLFANVCRWASLPSAAPGTPRFGCACCAPFDGCRPGDAPARAAPQVYAPAQIIEGAFTRAGAEQRAIPMLGCEPHSENFGGMLLLERGSSGFALARYVSGLFASQCWPVPGADGRDLLLCERSDAHQGVADDLFFQWDLALPEPQLAETAPLLATSDDEMSGCTSEPGRAVSSTRITARRLSSRASAVELDLELDVRQGQVTDAYLARCRELEQPAVATRPDAPGGPRTLLAGHVERLVLHFDGSRFSR